ncbi:DDE family endonuclease [Rhizoctonia solani AG-3 Rhs1AP]|uniref:DDE family endonuclease n=2 Tax=Rhizoctonia solani AG-3 TaxID=1086053 RepID=A0A074RGA3_9AGAM|nr:DDE family endonuclease [Rhizoctonia solani AG-3 Rhs1AP]KEP45769.1 DDE family endonuclease [Rhizoctonia solani 123E]
MDQESVGNRRFIPRNIKKLLLRMSRVLSREELEYASGVNRRTIRRINYLQRTTGDVVRYTILNGRPRVLSALDVEYIWNCVDHTPDSTLDEIRVKLEEERGTFVSATTVGRCLKRMNYSTKLVTRKALEANEQSKAQFVAEVGNGEYRPYHFVFVDETALNKHTMRRRLGRSPIGTRASRYDRSNKGLRHSILPALSLNGIIHLDVFPCAVTGAIFNAFIEGLLDVMNPWPRPNSVLVMDNAPIHKTGGIRELVEARGCRLLYLPPYSPQFNPIEEAFSVIKARIRRHRNEFLPAMLRNTNEPLYELIWEVVFSVTPQMAERWYHHSGYM